MKTKNLLLLLGLLIYYNMIQLHAQSDCTHGIKSAILDGNNVRATFFNQGSFIQGHPTPSYIWPADTNPNTAVSAIFAASIWLSGYDDAGNLRVAGPSYGFANDQHDFWPGPAHDYDTCQDWDRIWKVTDEKIQQHIDDWNDNGVIDGPIPEEVLLWPGSKNPHFMEELGFEMPSILTMAPFNDVDQDGIYDPEKGDAPYIQEATQALWWCVNDFANVHTEVPSDPLNFMVNYLVYSYESQNEAIDNTTFMHVSLNNMGDETMNDVHASLWLDPDLGCYTDDFIGSFPEADVAFVYNQDSVDGTTGCDCSTYNTYCEAPPVLSIKFLDGLKSEIAPFGTGMSSATYVMGSGIQTSPGMYSPETAEEFRNCMEGKWRDGTPLTVGELGYNTGSTETTKYAFAASTTQEDWNLCDVGSQGDWRMVMSTGPGTMPAGATNEFTIAITAIPNAFGPCVDGVERIEECANVIQNLFGNQGVPTKEVYLPSSTIAVYPNPMMGSTTFDFGALAGKMDRLEIIDVTGKIVRSYIVIEDNIVLHKKELHSGMYIYKVRTNSQQLISGKLMVL